MTRTVKKLTYLCTVNKRNKDMSATELFFAREQFSQELEAGDYRPEDAILISSMLSADALSLIAELGLEVAA